MAEFDEFDTDNLGGQIEPAPAPVTGYAAVGILDAEPASIQAWKASHAKLLAEKDAEEIAAKKELLGKGTATLKDWEAKHHQAKEARLKGNKEAEEEFVRLRDETTPGSEWERVARLVDLSSTTLKKGKKDTQRLRSVIIQCKSSGVKKNI